jgi:protein-disulfide isomerase
MNMEKLSVPIAIVISGALIAGALYYSNLKNPTTVGTVDTTTETTATDMRVVTSEDHILGNPNADLIIVEYSDTECPYCKVFHNTLKRVMNEYGKDGKVAWVYRHFPIDQLHSKARKEAEATECAFDQGGNEKFWEYINMLYDITNSNDSLDPAELPKIAKSVGLNVAVFNNCLSSGKFADKVEADYQDAVSASKGQDQVGTPNTIIISRDGTKTVIRGAQPYENVKRVIDALLK